MVDSMHDIASPTTDLVRLAQSGNTDAQEALLEPYWTPVFRLARRWVREPEGAEDLTQEIFVRIIRALPNYRSDAPFGCWVFRIALNTCRTASARREIAPELLEEGTHGDPRPGPEQTAVRRELQERIHHEVQRLHPSYRDAVLLRLVSGLSYGEVAETLGVPVEAARLRVHRGLKRLRKQLGPWLNGGDLP